MTVICAGRALLLAEHPRSRPHLWLVLTDPAGRPPQVVAVMVRTVTSFTDATLVLDVGDHPFIKHKSSVHYSTARLFRVDAIHRAIQRTQCHLQPDMSEQLMERVRQGLLDSPFTIKAVREYCRKRF